MRALVLSLVMLLPIVARANTETVFAAGLGGEASCGQVIAWLEEDPTLGKYKQTHQDGMTLVTQKEVVVAYVQGFITGVNYSRGPSAQIMADSPAIELWIRNYCNAHPTDKLVEAADQFTRSQAGRRPPQP
jgi:hypothetical protein